MSDMKIKTAAGKPDLALIPLTALHGVARVFAYGARKYERDNWKLAADKDAPRRYMAAILRHLSAMQDDPLALDEESGLPHVDHLGCSVVMLRGLLNIHHGAQVDPGEGREPPAKEPPDFQTGAREPADALDTNFQWERMGRRKRTGNHHLYCSCSDCLDAGPVRTAQ